MEWLLYFEELTVFWSVEIVIFSTSLTLFFLRKLNHKKWASLNRYKCKLKESESCRVMPRASHHTHSRFDLSFFSQNHNLNLRAYLQAALKQGGYRTLWVGCWPNVQRSALVNLGDLTTYDTAKVKIILLFIISFLYFSFTGMFLAVKCMFHNL